MSLSHSQKKDLDQISEQFKKIEDFVLDNKVDLDVYMTQYGKKGIAVYGTEKIELQAGKSEKRKKVFEKAGKEKTLSGKQVH